MRHDRKVGECLPYSLAAIFAAHARRERREARGPFRAIPLLNCGRFRCGIAAAPFLRALCPWSVGRKGRNDGRYRGGVNNSYFTRSNQQYNRHNTAADEQKKDAVQRRRRAAAACGRQASGPKLGGTDQPADGQGPQRRLGFRQGAGGAGRGQKAAPQAGQKAAWANLGAAVCCRTAVAGEGRRGRRSLRAEALL